MTPVPSTQPPADGLQRRASTMHGTRQLTSIEAFALALVEASSRLDGAPAIAASESPAHAAAHDEDGAPAAE